MTRIYREGSVTIVQTDQSYDSFKSEALSEFAAVVMNEVSSCEPPRMVLDMTDTAVITSGFVGVLIRALKELERRGGVLALCGVQPFCAEVLAVMRLDSLLRMYSGKEEAVAAMAT